MNEYVATFYTHLSAMLTCRALQQAGLTARMAPVPRTLSTSCGTGVFYEGEDLQRDCLDEDTEKVFAVTADGYDLLLELE